MCAKMVSGKDPLEEIHLKEWPRLEQILINGFPRGILMYNWIRMRLAWNVKEPGAHSFYILCPNGNIEEGLVTFGKVGNKTLYMTVYTFKDDVTALTNAILNTKRISWELKPVWGIPTEHASWFKDIVKEVGFTVHDDLPTHYYRVPMEMALSYDITCPPDVYIDKLKLSDVAVINDLWPHNFEGSEQYLTDILNLNYGYGVYSKADDKLLSWAMQYEYGDLAVLQTRDEYKQKGYAKLVVKTLSKEIARRGEDPYAFVVDGNKPSELLFTNLGYEYAGSYNWMEYQ